ncbi:acylating sulfoacetaldehyde dehydrogenase [Denitrobaculum tricleocarpae]|uniref:Aldehyde dehydrogenase family protein n=1 Tax=Denitrobaculum tricleocarpae TaxID=2591009 RepID=A0A545U0X8_9PROT|nr:aldehyde dehydrogenase family protein [Denitrobaculum tricleocarpae]TQV83131.1 aldehyde dehydrogenase family protein [Denitrobaculum tricleocarpae]
MSAKVTALEPAAGSAELAVADLMRRAHAAMDAYENHDQGRVDEAVTALAWSIYKPENAKLLAELAVEDTGLGNVDSKIIKNTRKTFGALRDLLRAKTVGVIEEDPAKGMVKYGKPVGVVGAVCPSTNPAATPVNKAMMALKGGNAVVIAPSPAGYGTTARTVELMRAELKKCNHPEDLVQILPAPVTKEMTQALINSCDLAVVTGSQNNVKRAMTSGTVAIGVGAGNVPVIIDDTADLDDAAEKITASKIFDNATSCSSENSVVILDAVYDQALDALKRAGGHLCDAGEKSKVLDGLWQNGHLNRHVIAKDMNVFAEVIGLSAAAATAKFAMVEDDRPGPDRPLSDEKLALVLTVYRARDFADAKRITNAILEVKGKGHSVGIHTANPTHARELAEETDVVRVLVNQAHTFGNGGSFNNTLPFTLSMGGGTWAGNSISENLNYRHFINITHLVTTIAEDKPSEEALFGGYWSKYGK